MTEYANAAPTKRFFIANLTRDLSLEDAILDLIDNAVDGLVRTRSIDISAAMLATKTEKPASPGTTSLIDIRLGEEELKIQDRCGGIGLSRARDYAFRFGNAEGKYSGSLGVYGIGMKRALFKLGNHFTVTSKTTADGFSMDVDVKEWQAVENGWQFPMELVAPADDQESAGTTICITELDPDIRMRLTDPTLLPRLQHMIGTTYGLFLERFLTISLNGNAVAARRVPLAESTSLAAGVFKGEFEGVSVQLLCGLSQRVEGEWNVDRAGWYVLCNGRVVVAADKSELTGWGTSVAQFASKYRGFVGIAYFFSSDPSSLPWTTFKRGLNRESQVFQKVRGEMVVLARPVLTFLNNMYPSDPDGEIVERRLVDALVPADVSALSTRPPSAFHAKTSGGRRRSSVSVQFKAEREEIDRIRKRLGKSSKWSAGSAGRHAFEYFLERECPE